MARGEIFVQLAVDFPNDTKVRALARYGKAARLARDLYVQMILYCRDLMTDGYVPDEQVGVLCYPDPPATGAKQAKMLADVELIERRDGGWYVPAYLKRNASRAQILATSEAKTTASQRANHERWHSKRDVSDPDCPLCVSGSQTGSQVGSGADTDRRGAGIRAESTETETETETEGGSSPTARYDRAPAFTPPQDPANIPDTGHHGLQEGPAGRPAPAARPAEPRGTNPPPERCARHINDPDPPNCGRCGDARRARLTWQAAEDERQRAARALADQQRRHWPRCGRCGIKHDPRGHCTAAEPATQEA